MAYLIKSKILTVFTISLLFLLNTFSFGATFLLTVKLFSNQELALFLNKVTSFFTVDPDGISANSIILFLFIFFPLNYLIYVGFLEGFVYLSKKINILELANYHSPEKIRHLLGILTFLIVLFGFFPLFVIIFTPEEGVKNSINSTFFIYVASFMCPYLYLIREDSVDAKRILTERQLMVFTLRKGRDMLARPLTGMMVWKRKTSNNRKPQLKLISVSIVLSIIAVFLVITSMLGYVISK